MKVRVDNSIHVEVKVIEFHTIRVRFGDVDGNGDAVVVHAGILPDTGDQLKVPIRDPPIERRTPMATSGSD
ncbi:hypothetical protein U1Q18_047062, partial [Sarracenia purpurea var. burkii]